MKKVLFSVLCIAAISSCQESAKVNTECVSLRHDFCVKTATCVDDITYNECLEVVGEAIYFACEKQQKTNFSLLNKCIEDFRSVKCKDDLNESCMFLQASNVE